MLSINYYAPPLGGRIKRRCCLTSVWRLRKTKISTEVAHVTHESDTTLKVKRSRSQGHIVAASRLQLVLLTVLHDLEQTISLVAFLVMTSRMSRVSPRDYVLFLLISSYYFPFFTSNGVKG